MLPKNYRIKTLLKNDKCKWDFLNVIRHEIEHMFQGCDFKIENNELFTNIKHETNTDKIKFILELEKSLTHVSADKENLIYSFRELCQNAEKAIGLKGSIIVKTNLDETNKNVKVEIIDNGQGVPSEIKKQIFDIGFRKRSGGTGLGLTIVKRCIEQHGGSIEETGIEGEGAHFVIKLPIKQNA